MATEFETIKNKISNPASFGPGIWYCIHRMARDANTEEKKQKFKEFIENIIINLPCQTCMDHATEYYKNNSLKDYWHLKENGKDVGLFRWAFNFHNTVNSRLKKPIVSWDSAKMLFSEEDGICTSDCGQTPIQVSSQNMSIPVSMIREDPLQRFIPKNIIRPNSIEKTKTVRFRNA